MNCSARPFFLPSPANNSQLEWHCGIGKPGVHPSFQSPVLCLTFQGKEILQKLCVTAAAWEGCPAGEYKQMCGFTAAYTMHLTSSRIGATD